MHLLARSLLGAVATAAALAATTATVSAATTLTCQASVLSGSAAGLPLALGQAGSTSAPCTDAQQSLTGNALAALRVGVGTATTTTTGGGAPVSAQAKLVGANVGVGALGITADAIDARVAGSCTTDFTSSGSVANLQVNGIPVDASGQLDLGVSGIAEVQLNHVTKTATGISRDAVRVVLLSGLASVTLGHAEIGGGGACAPGTSGGGDGGPGDGGGGGTTDAVTGAGGTGTTPGGGTVPGGGTPGTTPNNGTNANECARIRMWFVPRVKHTARYKTHPGPSSVTSGIEHGVRRVTRGTIKDCKDRPIVRARIDVFHIVNGKKMRKTGIRSRRDGLLTLILPSNLRTRSIRFEYRPRINGKKVATRVTLRKTLKDKSGRILS